MNSPARSTAPILRLLWLLMAAACTALFVIGTLDVFNTPLPSCAGTEADCPADVILTIEDVRQAEALGFPLPLLPVVMFFSISARLSLAIVGAIIFWKRSGDWMALIMSGGLLSSLLEGIQGLDPAAQFIQRLLFAIGTGMYLFIPFVFPSARFEPPRLKWPVASLIALYSAAVVFGQESAFFWTLTAILTVFWVVLGGYAMVYRYRKVSNAVERQQTKWVLLGLAATFVVGIDYAVTNTFFPASEPSQARISALLINLMLYLAGYSFLAFSVMVAMLRYRLWDIDVLIRRTLQYTLLTGLLALVYFVVVVVLQGILGPLTGERSSPLVTVLTTLGIAAIFTPLRTRVQQLIDRRFYRKKYDAERSLAQFTDAARDEVDMTRLTETLLGVVSETMQPAHASLWLRAGREGQ